MPFATLVLIITITGAAKADDPAPSYLQHHNVFSQLTVPFAPRGPMAPLSVTQNLSERIDDNEAYAVYSFTVGQTRAPFDVALGIPQRLLTATLYRFRVSPFRGFRVPLRV